MKPVVHILAFVRKLEMLPGALLVFETLRTGFPNAEVKVWGNGLQGQAEAAVRNAAAGVGAWFGNLAATSHDAWVEGLLQTGLEPFWICDPDIIFWKKVEGWSSEQGFMGRLEPEFEEEWTGTRHMERLHTSLMWFDPGLVRAKMRKWMARVPPLFSRSAQFAFVRQEFVALAGEMPLFYDTCAGLYHAIGGEAFTERQNSAFEHLHCASYADMIGLQGLQEAHQAIYAKRELARGMRKVQDEFYRSRAPKVKLGTKGTL